ncbi:hypothetical protein BH23PLA1_BH23PLA1_37390 [soil metagenome]
MSMATIEREAPTTPKPSTPISEARRIASRLNGARSRGPKTTEGKERSRKNALKHGLTGQGTTLPGAIAEKVEVYRVELTREFRPIDAAERLLVEQAAVASARLARAFDVEQAQRIEMSQRALHGWDLDCRAEIESLAARLASHPARIASELLTSRQGADWLLDRWAGLSQVLHKQGEWDDDQRRLAADLLGVPPELRNDHPCIDPETPFDALADLIRREVRAIKRLLQLELIDRDNFNRELAELGLSFDVSALARRLRNYEAASQRILNRVYAQIRQRRAAAAAVPVIHGANDDLDDLDNFDDLNDGLDTSLDLDSDSDSDPANLEFEEECDRAEVPPPAPLARRDRPLTSLTTELPVPGRLSTCASPLFSGIDNRKARRTAAARARSSATG